MYIIKILGCWRYEIEGFLEKNRDTVQEEQLNILKASQVRSRMCALLWRWFRFLLKILFRFNVKYDSKQFSIKDWNAVLYSIKWI